MPGFNPKLDIIGCDGVADDFDGIVAENGDDRGGKAAEIEQKLFYLREGIECCIISHGFSLCIGIKRKKLAGDCDPRQNASDRYFELS